MSVFAIWLVLLLMKLAIGLVVPLSFDESYYWVWAQDLQLSYFDHPAMVAVWLKFGSVFDGFLSAVRWPSIALGHLSYLIWNEILKPHLSLDRRKAFMWLCGLSPLLGFGGFVVTPDLPLLLFWSLSVYFFQRALQNHETKDYIFLGISMGLAFCSKYNAVLLLPAFILIFYFHENRSQMNKKGVLLLILSGLVFSSPPILWNILNDFESFRFQSAHGLKGKGKSEFWPGLYLLSQVALIFPPVLYFALRARAGMFLRTLAWLPILFFFLTSFKGKVEGNWPLVAYPAVIALSVLGSNSLAWVKYVAGIWVFCFSLVVIQYFYPILPIKDLDRKLNEVRTTHYLKEKLEGLEPLYASSYQIASKIRYEWRREIFKVRGVSRVDYYDKFPESVPQKGKFYVIGARSDTKFAMRKRYKFIKKRSIDDRFAYFELENE